MNKDGEVPLDVADGSCKVLLGGKRSASDDDDSEDGKRYNSDGETDSEGEYDSDGAAIY